MRSKEIFGVGRRSFGRILQVGMILAAVALWPGTPPSALAQPAGGEAAQDYAAKVRQMQQVIELQQRQLQAQQKQLEQQQQMLRALQEQVSGLVKAERQPAATPAPAQAAAPKTAAVPKAAKQAEEDWPGSFAVAGSKTRMALGGFAELDLIHDTGAITSPADFVTADIVTRGPPRPRARTARPPSA